MDVTEQSVRSLAAAAGLPLGPEREALVAPQLAVWLDAANELSRTLSAAEHSTVTPITVFTHPEAPGVEE
jgi:hypothetical protein